MLEQSSASTTDPSSGTLRFARRSRVALAWLLTGIALIALGASDADARARAKGKAQHHRVVHGPSYHPPYSALVVDANSGRVLHEVSADEPRHPASLTKIMTLYLLFEQLEAGNLRLNTPLPISVHASEQAPTKLGLRPGQTIAVEDAIKGLVTKSANDAAAVVAEAIAGSEEEFAARMTRKARALGMSGTTYVNASGLPADAQITTARDQVTLGRAIQTRFPNYYAYFATPRFQYRGASMNNHNTLLATVDGVDGIKTGYTEASGYNLVTSIHRNNRHLVCVVLGGTSNGQRDARMRQLIEENIARGATERTAPAIVENPDLEKDATYSLSTKPEPAVPAAMEAPPAPAGDADVGGNAAKPAVLDPPPPAGPTSTLSTGGTP
jgi:D-alanyl-D-alanine carboxypeptidase